MSQNQNTVPGYAQWYYGLAIRSPEGLSVRVYQRNGPQSFDATGSTWDDIHAYAAAEIVRRLAPMPKEAR